MYTHVHIRTYILQIGENGFHKGHERVTIIIVAVNSIVTTALTFIGSHWTTSSKTQTPVSKRAHVRKACGVSQPGLTLTIRKAEPE